MDRRSFICSAMSASLGLSACRGAAASMPILPQSEFPESGLFRMDADPESGFHWPYFLYVPRNIVPNARLVVLGPNNLISENLSKLERELRTWFEWIVPGISEPLGMPVLLAAFVRPRTEDRAGNLYTHALSRAALLTETEILKRVDLQTLAMVDDAQKRFKSANKNLDDDRVFMTGYSAGADFAQRMTVLHPEKILACAVGGIGAMPTLPILKYRETELSYPVGVADLELLSGKAFSREKFQQTPLLIVQGSRDKNDSVGSLDSYSTQQSEFIRREFGKAPIDRVSSVSKVFEDFGMVKFELRVHDGDGHRITDRYLNEIVNWFRSAA